MTNSKNLKTMNLEELRCEIDRLDEEIVRLLGKRASTAIEIGRNKIKSNTPFQNAEREKAVIERAKELNDGPIDSKSLESIYREIIEACTRVQEHTSVLPPDEDQ